MSSAISELFETFDRFFLPRVLSCWLQWLCEAQLCLYLFLLFDSLIICEGLLFKDCCIFFTTVVLQDHLICADPKTSFPNSPRFLIFFISPLRLAFTFVPPIIVAIHSIFSKKTSQEFRPPSTSISQADPPLPPGPRVPAVMAATATILLDSQHKHYTNLDFLSGKVVLNLPTEAAIGGIQVKLEGESRTRLSGPRNPHNLNSDKKRNESEVHKVGSTPEMMEEIWAI